MPPPKHPWFRTPLIALLLFNYSEHHIIIPLSPMAKEIELAPGRWVGGSHPCFIIAEVGQNHQGDMDIAKTLIRAAKVQMILIMYILFKCIVKKGDLLALCFSRKSHLHIL